MALDYIKYTDKVGIAWYKDVLPEEGAKRFDVRELPLLGDVDIARTWELKDFKDAAACVEFLKHKTSVKYIEVRGDQHWIDDPIVDGKVIPGRFRCVDVRVMDEGRAKFPVQFLRKGFARKLEWSEARLASGSRNPSAASSISGIANTSTDNPQRSYTIRFPNLDPASCQSIADSAPATIPASTSIDGEAIPTGLRLRAVAIGKEDDGTGYVEAVYAVTQLTLSGYTDFLGSRQATHHQLYEVPQELAQGIMDAWSGTAGHSALPGSFDPTKGVVDLRLSAIAGGAVYATILNFEEACDTKTSYYYGWKLTSAEKDLFLGSDTGTTPPGHPAPAAMSGVRRKLIISERGDGYFDVAILQSKTTFEAAKHILHTYVHIGLRQTTETCYGWNVPMADLSNGSTGYVDTLAKTAVAAAVGVVRVTDCRVTREDDCTFDFVYQIVTFVAGYGAVFPIMNDGIILKMGRRYWNQYLAPTADPDGEDNQAAQPSTTVDEDHWPVIAAVGNERKIEVVQLEEHNGGLYDYTLILTELLKTTPSGADPAGHIIDQQATSVYEDNLVKVHPYIDTGTAYAAYLWFMRRSRPVTQTVTRYYSLIAALSSAAVVTKIEDAGSGLGFIVKNRREICGYDEQRGIHYKDQILTVLGVWTAPTIYRKQVQSTDVDDPGVEPTDPWNSGSAGWPFV